MTNDINIYDDDESPFEGFDNELTKIKNLQKSLSERTRQINDAYINSLQSGIGEAMKEQLAEMEEQQKQDNERRKNPSFTDKVRFFIERITKVL